LRKTFLAKIFSICISQGSPKEPTEKERAKAIARERKKSCGDLAVEV
jgi:hypothetical protein